MPVVFFLALLLSSADPIFSKELERILNIDQLAGICRPGRHHCGDRLSAFGYLSLCIAKEQPADLIGLEKPWFAPFLGFTESSIILGSVNLLFAFFVAVQFKYFFGGQANITLDGYTFAEYARKGFGELITVAVISLMLYLGLSTITRREANLQTKMVCRAGCGPGGIGRGHPGFFVLPLEFTGRCLWIFPAAHLQPCLHGLAGDFAGGSDWFGNRQLPAGICHGGFLHGDRIWHHFECSECGQFHLAGQCKPGCFHGKSGLFLSAGIIG